MGGQFFQEFNEIVTSITVQQYLWGCSGRCRRVCAVLNLLTINLTYSVFVVTNLLKTFALHKVTEKIKSRVSRY